MPRPGLRQGLAGVAGLLLAIGIALVVLAVVSSGKSHPQHPPVRVVRPATTAPPPRPRPRPLPSDTPWPLYGYNLARTRFFPHGAKLDPPLRVGWTFGASGGVKGGVAFAHDTIYFGDYGGGVHAVNAASGQEIWSASGGDSFYSTPAVAFGRVYIGNTNGDVYAFWASSGATAWTASTGAYVYASPAVADVPGRGPTVYVGSYDGVFYAYDANSGAVRWSHSV